MPFVAFVAGVAYGSWVETIDQLKAEIDSLSKALKDTESDDALLDSSNAAWFQLDAARSKLPGLVAMVQSVLEYMDHLERSAERHLVLAHEHMRNGDSRMSQRARTQANQESRSRALLFCQLTNAWNEAMALQDEAV